MESTTIRWHSESIGTFSEEMWIQNWRWSRSHSVQRLHRSQSKRTSRWNDSSVGQRSNIDRTFGSSSTIRQKGFGSISFSHHQSIQRLFFLLLHKCSMENRCSFVVWRRWAPSVSLGMSNRVNVRWVINVCWCQIEFEQKLWKPSTMKSKFKVQQREKVFDYNWKTSIEKFILFLTLERAEEMNFQYFKEISMGSILCRVGEEICPVEKMFEAQVKGCFLVEFFSC